MIVSITLAGCGSPEAASHVPEAKVPVAPVRAEAVSVPDVSFVDITEEAGIDFVHHNAATGEKLLPETMGSGVAFLDYDNDGHPDLLIINSCPWPDQEDSDAPAPTQKLYRNDGTGHFLDVTAEAGLDVTLFGQGVAVGDYDNDGWPDIYITTIDGGRLFRNDQGRFVDVTEETGTRAQGWLTSAAFLDYDNDGDLDLFLCTYLDWSPEYDRSQGFQLTGQSDERAYGPPTAFGGVYCVLLRNDGGTFVDVSEEAGIRVRTPHDQAPIAKALGVAPFDVDGDGWVDIAVANDTVPNFLFHNQGDGTFEEIGIIAGVAFDASGSPRGDMGIDWSYFLNDTRLGLATGNFANEMAALYVSDDPRTLQFSDLATIYGLGAPTQPPLTFGLFFFDYDNDGRLDLLLANGHLESDITKVQASQSYAQRAQLFWNSGQPGRDLFVLVGSDTAGPDLFTPIVGRGSAYADIDGDGDLDVVLTDNGGRVRLLRNEGGDRNAWIRLKLIGRESNRDAIGARVTLRNGETEQRRQLFPAKSYLSSVELPLTFGLGEADKADAVTIVWPSGRTTELTDLDARHLYIIDELDGVQP